MLRWQELQFRKSVFARKAALQYCRATVTTFSAALLPFAAEYWRSSMTSLFSRVLEAPFPTIRMTFPFGPPAHWRNYERMFGCQVEFDANVMEWHFDVDVLEKPSPNANAVTAQI